MDTQPTGRLPNTLFRTPLRAGVALILILLGLGQLSGRLLNINSIDVLAYEKILRADLLDELKYLAVTAAESQSLADQQLYAEVLQEEFRFAATQLQDPKVAAAVLASKANATRRWPIQARRENWTARQLPFTTAELVQQVLSETRKQRPFLSGNDRSRWLTVRALVERGTYEIDDFVTRDFAWDTIDMVSHANAVGEPRLYSSKPPLQATLLAGPYWVIHKVTGWTLGDHPFEIGRLLLFLVNLLPLGIAWWFVARLLDEWSTSDWTFVVLLAATCFATLLSTFAIVLTNHLWGAISAVLATWYATRCWQGSRQASHYLGVGFWLAFTFTCELPAAGLVVLFGLMLFVKVPRPTLVLAVPVASLVIALYFATNWIAHGTLRPPYSYGAGDVDTTDSVTVENWYDYKYIRQIDGKEITSYWKKPNNPLDLGEANKGLYVVHSLIGHHGVFSLTPLFLLTIPGLYYLIRQGRSDQRLWAIAVAVTSVACLYFYLWHLDTRQRNYGGQSSAFRQLLWLHPLWLLATVPVVDRLSHSRAGQWLVGLLLALSIMAASYPTWNPWTQTWIWNALVWLGINPLSVG